MRRRFASVLLLATLATGTFAYAAVAGTGSWPSRPLDGEDGYPYWDDQILATEDSGFDGGQPFALLPDPENGAFRPQAEDFPFVASDPGHDDPVLRFAPTGSDGEPVPPPIPEPSSMLLLGTGIAGLARFGKRRFCRGGR